MARVTEITLSNRDKWYCVETAMKVANQREDRMKSGTLMVLESTRIPSGQLFYLNPTEISVIRTVDR